MADKPVHPRVELSNSQAAAALGAWLGAEPSISEITPMTGGCVDTVLEIVYGADGQRVVLKVSTDPEEKRIGGEFARLQFIRDVSEFPVPEAHFCDLSGSIIPHSFFIMDRLEGVHLGEADWMSDEGHEDLQRQIGYAVANLHTAHAPWFGTIGEALPAIDNPTPEQQHWSKWFQRRMAERIEQAADDALLSPQTIKRLRALTLAFDQVFKDDETPPTLVHGDIWATNIVVARDERPGMARLSGFVDPPGFFAHPEYELAYLEIWRTVGEPFFQAYGETHDVDAGYPARRHFYWINTLVQHVNAFKTDYYVESASALVDQIWEALGG
jgi:fructosamine-3-kinase